MVGRVYEEGGGGGGEGGGRNQGWENGRKNASFYGQRGDFVGEKVSDKERRQWGGEIGSRFQSLQIILFAPGWLWILIHQTSTTYYSLSLSPLFVGNFLAAKSSLCPVKRSIFPSISPTMVSSPTLFFSLSRSLGVNLPDQTAATVNSSPSWPSQATAS